MSKLRDSSNPEESLLGVANLGLDQPYALFGQAYQAYMGDLRSGKFVGTVIEKVIWAILVNRSDLVRIIDREFPDLFDDVFND